MSQEERKSRLVSTTVLGTSEQSTMNLQCGWLTALLLLVLLSSAVVDPVNGFLSRSSPTVAFRRHAMSGRRPVYANQQSSRPDHDDDNRSLELALLERKVSVLTHQLEQEERRATHARNEWVMDRTQLVHKISGLTTLLKESQQHQHHQQQAMGPHNDDDDEEENNDAMQALTLELTMSRESEQELGQEMDRLEREVKILQHQIVQIRNLYKTEQYIVQDLEAQLQAAQQQQEDEQVEWQRLAEAQKRHLESLTLQLQSMELKQQFLASSSSSTSTSPGYSRRNETLSAAPA